LNIDFCNKNNVLSLFYVNVKNREIPLHVVEVLSLFYFILFYSS